MGTGDLLQQHLVSKLARLLRANGDALKGITIFDLAAKVVVMRWNGTELCGTKRREKAP